MRINESQSCSKNLLHAKKNGGYWLNTINYSNKPVFLASTEEKKSIKCIWTISIWQTHKDHYQKFLSGHRIDDRFSYARFEIYFQTVFLSEQFFFGLNIVCQLLARHLSKKIEPLKNYSDELISILAQIRPFFTCTYLALLFCVNKWKSIPLKKLAACKKEWWILVKYHALIKYTRFLGVDKRKKIN